MRYPITLTLDDNDTFLATCPTLPEVTTFGNDEADALAHARDAVLGSLERRVAHREAIPLPGPVSGSSVTLPAIVGAKVALHNAMVETDTRKAELARRLGWHPPQVDRLLDLDHASKLEQLEEALRAVGREIEITTRAA